VYRFVREEGGRLVLEHTLLTTSLCKQEQGTPMPLYLIERNFAEQLNVTSDAATNVTSERWQKFGSESSRA
jgi:hypothetical protein